MRWVTYLSPSGGARRPGVIDDGCVFGYPGSESFADLASQETDRIVDAHRHALAEPVEIIVEFEARLCAPLVPTEPVRTRAAGRRLLIDPGLVRGADDGVAPPVREEPLLAAVGAAALLAADGRHIGHALACLWQTADRDPVTLTLGPSVVTRDELGAADPVVTAGVADTVLATATVDAAFTWADGTGGIDVVADVPAETRPLDPGEELFIDGGDLGAIELRVPESHS